LEKAKEMKNNQKEIDKAMQSIAKRKQGRNKLIYDKHKKKIISVSSNGNEKEVLDMTPEEANNI